MLGIVRRFIILNVLSKLSPLWKTRNSGIVVSNTHAYDFVSIGGVVLKSEACVTLMSQTFFSLKDFDM